VNCRQAENLISAYLDGELEGGYRAEIEAHLASCPACRQYAEELEAAQAALAGIFAAAEPPADLLERVMARVRSAGAETPVSRQAAAFSGWRRTFAVAGLAAAVVLACLQFGEARLNPFSRPVAPVPQVAVNEPAQPQPVGPGRPAAPEVDTSPEVETSTPAAESPAPEAGAPEASPSGETATPEAIQGGEAPAAGEKRGEPSGSILTDKEVRAAAGEVRVALADTAAGPAKTFLSHARHLRTTVVRLGVEDLEAARAGVTETAVACGAVSVDEAWTYQDRQMILRVLLPVGSAARFAAQVSTLGEVLGRSTETANVTNEFERRLAEYRELSAKEDPQSKTLAEAAEKVLEALDRESLEAGREVVNVWLQLR
jgi:hypothetical protein